MTRRNRGLRPYRRAGARSGSGFLELLIAISVVAVGLLAYSRSMVDSVDLAEANRETTVATAAAQRMVERLYAMEAAQVLALYNGDPTDDPAGAGSAPGSGFAVEGLAVRAGDADGLAGEIVFPLDGGGTLREDLDEATFRMPRDLDLDGAVDGADRGADYELLPVCVRVGWHGASGERQVEIRTILGGHR